MQTTLSNPFPGEGIRIKILSPDGSMIVIVPLCGFVGKVIVTTIASQRFWQELGVHDKDDSARLFLLVSVMSTPPFFIRTVCLGSLPLIHWQYNHPILG